MFDRLIHSISAKLLLLFICGGVILLLLVGAIISNGLSGNFITNTGAFLLHYAELLEQDIGEAPTLEAARKVTENSPVDVHYFSNAESWTTAATPVDLKHLHSLVAVNQAKTPSLGKYQIKVSGKKLFLYSRSDKHEIFFQISSPQHIERDSYFGITILASIFATLLLIYYVTKTFIKPIESIQYGIKRIGSGDLNHRIIRQRNDELGDLADEVNTMADDIQGMLEAKRQMLLGISHELRSPITRSRVHLALMEDSDSKQEIEKDIIAMESMISELLESEKLSGRHVSLNLESVKLSLLIKELVHKEFRRKIKIMEIAEVRSEVDPARFKLLLRNLFQNAIKYSGIRKRRPAVSLVVEIDQFCVYVTDRGGGIDPNHIPLLTEPFYRADPSRQRKTGGYGLGLHLCKAIVEAHSGDLSITSEASQGTTIRCAFPYVS